MATPRAKAAEQALRRYDDDRHDHDKFVRDCEQAYKAYRGVLEKTSKAAEWTTKLHPPYVWQIIETIVGGLIDQRPKWRLVPSVRFDAPPEQQQLQQAARQLELLLETQRSKPGLVHEQRVHRLQALICRVTATKQTWRYTEQPLRRSQTYSEPLLGADGVPFGEVTKQRMVEQVEVVCDDPQTEVVDVRHLVWPQSASSPQALRHVTQRLWLSFEELKRLECKTAGGRWHEGGCSKGIYHDVDKIKEAARQSSGETTATQAQDLFDYRPHKDDVELLEHWYFEDDGTVWLTVLADRVTLLRHMPSPYNHGKLPYVFCAANPYPFRLQGISDVEQIEQSQTMMWSLQNQRLDNVRLVNNAIVLLRDDIDDPDSFEWYPGAINLVSDPAQVQMFTPDVRVAEVSLTAEQFLKQDLQAISGGMPWLAGDNRGTSSETATEASIITNLAQKRVAAKKQFFLEADAEAANQFIDLNDQFLTEQRYVQIVGADGKQGWQLIDPSVFRDYRFRVHVESSDESLIRQERRAEAQAKLQVALSAAPVFAAYAQAGAGQPLNVRAFMDDYLDACDIRDKDRYYTAAPAPPALPAAGQPGQTQPQGNGVSAPQATDANSPSNAFSQSPVAAMQRMLASTGGPVNQ